MKSSDPYEGTKFQMDFIRAELSRRAGPSAQVRHFTVDPGGVNSSISAALDNGLSTYIKILMLYLVRLEKEYFFCLSWVSTKLISPLFFSAGSVVR